MIAIFSKIFDIWHDRFYSSY